MNQEQAIQLQKTYVTLTSIFNDTLTAIFWVIALPVRGTAWVILAVRKRRYDPEKVLCPCCGYRGERGSNHRTCTVDYTPTSGPELAALKHTCYRCHAPFFTGTFLPAKSWMINTPQDQMARVRATMAKGEL